MSTAVNSKTTVAVVIPAYNIEEYIARAIESVLAQSRPADEIIVVDDGSTDGTAEVIKGFGEAVRYIYQENAGLAAARNTGIRQAKGEWIAFLDGDDEWLEGAIEKHLAIVARHEDLMWVSGNFIRCLCDEGRRGPSLPEDEGREVLGGKDYFEDYFYACRKRSSGHPNTMFIRREVFEKVGFFEETQRFAEDLDMWWRIGYRCPKVGYVVEPTAVYHMVRTGTLTQSYESSKMGILSDLVARHLTLAEEAGRLALFEPLAGFLVKQWIRGMLFYNCPDDVRKMLARFGHLLSPGFKFLVSVLMVWPGVTAWGCHRISKVVRRYNLRRQIIRRPIKPLVKPDNK